MKLLKTIILFFIILMITNAFTSYFTWNTARFDVVAYWDASVRLLQGQALYATGSMPVQAKAYIYPPTFAALFAPITLLPPLWGYAYWMSFQIIAFFFLILGVLRLAGITSFDANSREHLGFLTLIVILLIAPVVANFQEGQVNLILMAILAWAFIFLEEGSLKWAGFLIALATQIKVIPGILLLGFLFWKNYRITKYFLISCTLLFFVPTLWLIPKLGWRAVSYTFEVNHDYITYVIIPGFLHHTIAGYEQLFSPNYSLIAVFSRLFGEGVHLSPFNDSLSPLLFSVPKLVISIFTFTIGGVFIWSALKVKSPILLLISGMLLNPSFWEHHLIVTALLIATLYKNVPKKKHLQESILYSLPFLGVVTLPFLIQFFMNLFFKNEFIPYRISRDYGLPTIALILLWWMTKKRLVVQEKE